MAKRGASKQLTQDNYDKSDSDDDNIGETPTFASEEVLKTRVIKTGRRRLGTTNGETGKNIFAGFQGFGSGNAPAKDAKPSFNFVSSTPATKPATELDSTKPEVSNQSSYPDSVFRAKVVMLNSQFVKWAQEQVDKMNGIADLTPCMESYQKHLEELKKELKEEKGKGAATGVSLQPATTFEFGAGSTKTTEPAATISSFSTSSFSSTVSKPSATVSVPTSSLFSFGTSTAASSAPAVSAAPVKFSFGAPVSSSETTKTEPKFSFGVSPAAEKLGTSAPATTGNPLLGGTTFSFGLPKPTTTGTFSFGTTNSAPAPGFFSTPSTQASQPEKSEDGEDGPNAEEEEQQKFEKKDVKETDAFFEARTKLFYLAGKEFKSRGVGNLFLKNVGEKVQMVVRADNSLGNLLLNVFVKNVNPKLEQNKKSVSMWCIPNPAIDTKSTEQPKPTKFLFQSEGRDHCKGISRTPRKEQLD